MFSINDTNIVFAVLTDTEDPMVDIQRMEKIAITMFANKKSEPWSAVYLYFDEEKSLSFLAVLIKICLYHSLGKNLTSLIDK